MGNKSTTSSCHKRAAADGKISDTINTEASNVRKATNIDKNTDSLKASDTIHDNTKDAFRFKPDRRYFSIMVYGLIFVFFSILIIKFIGNFEHTLSLIGHLISLLAPFIIGAFIAFILFPLVKFFQKYIFGGLFRIKSALISKWLAIISAYLTAIGCIAILLVFIIPQIYYSLSEIADRFPVWYNSCVEYISNFEANNPEIGEMIDFNFINEKIESAMPNIINTVTDAATGMIPVIFTTSVAIVKGVFNFIIAVIVSIYIIADYKNIFFHAKRLIYVLMPVKTADSFRVISKDCCKIFSRFIYSSMLDSICVGLVCFILMSILNLPYAVLISVIIGITNLIPYFGPYIGGFLGGMFILIVSPFKTLVFAILILCIQQIEGFLIAPRILGNSTGLKPLWVIVSITVGGGLFGVAGMYLGVPCVAVISYLLNLFVTWCLKKKNIEITPYTSNHEM